METKLDCETKEARHSILEKAKACGDQGFAKVRVWVHQTPEFCKVIDYLLLVGRSTYNNHGLLALMVKQLVPYTIPYAGECLLERTITLSRRHSEVGWPAPFLAAFNFRHLW